MKLHLDSAAFRVLIDAIHQKTGYREDVLEKDCNADFEGTGRETSPWASCLFQGW